MEHNGLSVSEYHSKGPPHASISITFCDFYMHCTVGSLSLFFSSASRTCSCEGATETQIPALSQRELISRFATNRPSRLAIGSNSSSGHLKSEGLDSFLLYIYG